MRSLAVLVTLWVAPVLAQTPRLAAVFPPGGRPGTTVEVVLRGAVQGARDVLCSGAGVTAEVQAKQGRADPEDKALYESKCQSCHELRSPANRQFAPAQWATVVDTMINQKGADISQPDRDRIVAYLQQEAASGLVTAKVTIAPDATEGPQELRVVTPNGASTAYPFYVSKLAQTTEFEPNNSLPQAQPLKLPAVVNGTTGANGDTDFVSFAARRGQRLTCRASAFALNNETQGYYDCCLFLYGPDGKFLTRSLGFEDLDPLIDYTVPQDGTYSLEVRDLLYRGGPGDVYRLEVGELGYHQTVYPLGGQRGESVEAVIFSANQEQRSWRGALSRKLAVGIDQLLTPYGSFKFQVSDYPDEWDKDDGRTHVVRIPCAINGWIGQTGEQDRYLINVRDDQVRVLRRWALCGPFDASDAGLDGPLGPERELLAGRFEQTTTYADGGETRKWEFTEPAANGILRLAAGRSQVWYALHAFELRQAETATLALGTDDGCKVWANGELVHLVRGVRPAVPADDLIPIRLRRGTNTILVKVLNISGPGGLTAAAAAFTIEAFAQRLGSPLKPRLRLGFGNSWLADSRNGPGGDARIDYSFGRPGEYGIQIESAEGQGGQRYGYRLVIGPTEPEIALTIYPANPAVPRGGRVPLFVKRTALSGYRGDLQLSVSGLPDGVTADMPVLPADQDTAVILLGAGPQTSTGCGPIEVSARVPGSDYLALARPLDHYRIQNNQIPVERHGMAAAALPQNAPYSLSVEPDEVSVDPGESTQVKVTLERHGGFNGDVTVVPMGLPNGIRADTAVLRGNKLEATLNVNFGQGLARTGFGESQTPGAYRFIFAGLNGGDGITGGVMYSTPAVVCVPSTGRRRPARAEPVQTGRPTELPGRAVLEKRCTTCHALVDPTQTKKTATAWVATVDRMINNHNARISGVERAQIIAYLRTVASGN